MPCLTPSLLLMDISRVTDVTKHAAFCVSLGIEELNCNDNPFYHCRVTKQFHHMQYSYLYRSRRPHVILLFISVNLRETWIPAKISLHSVISFSRLQFPQAEEFSTEDRFVYIKCVLEESLLT